MNAITKPTEGEAQNWLLESTDLLFPFQVELHQDALGWAKYASLMSKKKWRIRSYGVLSFEDHDDAGHVFNVFGSELRGYEAKSGEKLQKTTQMWRQAQNRDSNRSIKGLLIEQRSKGHLSRLDRHLLAFQMFVANYSTQEIATELEYDSEYSIVQAINYIQKQKLREVNDFAIMYRNENLAALSSIKHKVLAQISREKHVNTKLISCLLNIMAEEHKLTGAYEAERIEVEQVNQIENLSTQELIALVQKLPPIIDAEESNDQ